MCLLALTQIFSEYDTSKLFAPRGIYIEWEGEQYVPDDRLVQGLGSICHILRIYVVLPSSLVRKDDISSMRQPGLNEPVIKALRIGCSNCRTCASDVENE